MVPSTPSRRPQRPRGAPQHLRHSSSSSSSSSGSTRDRDMVSATPAQKVNGKEPMNNYVSANRVFWSQAAGGKSRLSRISWLGKVRCSGHERTCERFSNIGGVPGMAGWYGNGGGISRMWGSYEWTTGFICVLFCSICRSIMKRHPQLSTGLWSYAAPCHCCWHKCQLWNSFLVLSLYSNWLHCGGCFNCG